MKAKNGVWIHLLRALFLTLTVCMLFFIFHQSSQDGETSSQQSVEVTVQVQQIVGAIDPDSPIATAEGEDFELLHAFVRTAAHCVEYGLLGACMFASYLSFTRKKRYAVLIPLSIVLVAIFDEYTQTFSGGRAAELMDILVDSAGGLMGCVFTTLVFLLIRLLIKHSRRKGSAQQEAVNG